MAQNITKSSKDIVKSALAAVPAISAEEAISLVDSPDHVFVDRLKSQPILAIPRKERSLVLLVVVEPYEARAVGERTKSERDNS